MYIATRVRASLAPHILGDGLYERDLSPLLFLGELVAFLSGGETALGGQAQTVERHILGRFGNAGLDRFRIFQFRLFGGNQAEHDLLVAGNLGERFEVTGTVIVELK